MAAVNLFGLALKSASRTLRADREVVLTAVEAPGPKRHDALRYAGWELRSDADLVLAAVRTCGYSLRNASPELRANRRIVKAAVLNDSRALRFAAKELRDNRDFLCDLLGQKPYALQHMLSHGLLDSDFIVRVLAHYPHVASYGWPKGHFAVLADAIDTNPAVADHFSWNLLSNCGNARDMKQLRQALAEAPMWLDDSFFHYENSRCGHHCHYSHCNFCAEADLLVERADLCFEKKQKRHWQRKQHKFVFQR